MITIKAEKGYLEVPGKGMFTDKVLTDYMGTTIKLDPNEIVDIKDSSPTKDYVFDNYKFSDLKNVYKTYISNNKQSFQEGGDIDVYKDSGLEQLINQGLKDSAATIAKPILKSREKLDLKASRGHLSKEDLNTLKYTDKNLASFKTLNEAKHTILGNRKEDFVATINAMKRAPMEKEPLPQEAMYGGKIKGYQKGRTIHAKVHLNGKDYGVTDPTELQAAFPDDLEKQNQTQLYYYKQPNSTGNFSYREKNKTFTLPGTPVQRQSDGSYRMASAKPTVTETYTPTVRKAQPFIPSDYATPIDDGRSLAEETRDDYRTTYMPPVSVQSDRGTKFETSARSVPNTATQATVTPIEDPKTATYSNLYNLFKQQEEKREKLYNDAVDKVAKFDVSKYDMDNKKFRNRQLMNLIAGNIPYAGLEKQGYYPDTTPNKLVQYNEDPYIQNNSDLMASQLEETRNMSPNMNNAMLANMYANSMNVSSDVRMKLSETNNQLYNQYVDRERNRNQYNNQMAIQVDDINARNRAARRDQFGRMISNVNDINMQNYNTEAEMNMRKMNIDLYKILYPTIANKVIAS